jgi:hypothetical protein
MLLAVELEAKLSECDVEGSIEQALKTAQAKLNAIKEYVTVYPVVHPHPIPCFLSKEDLAPLMAKLFRKTLAHGKADQSKPMSERGACRLCNRGYSKPEEFDAFMQHVSLQDRLGIGKGSWNMGL